MQYFDLCTKKTWEQNGETRHKFLNIGTLRETDDGKKFIELNHLPNTPIYVFEPKKKQSELDF